MRKLQNNPDTPTPVSLTFSAKQTHDFIFATGGEKSPNNQACVKMAGSNAINNADKVSGRKRLNFLVLGGNSLPSIVESAEFSRLMLCAAFCKDPCRNHSAMVPAIVPSGSASSCDTMKLMSLFFLSFSASFTVVVNWRMIFF